MATAASTSANNRAWCARVAAAVSRARLAMVFDLVLVLVLVLLLLLLCARYPQVS